MKPEARCRNCVHLDHYGDCYKVFEGLRTECKGDAVRVKPDFCCVFFIRSCPYNDALLRRCVPVKAAKKGGKG
jgi:hypothetical protein